MDLFAELDEYVSAVDTGELVHVATTGISVAATGSEGLASGITGERSIEVILAVARSGRSRGRGELGVRLSVRCVERLGR